MKSSTNAMKKVSTRTFQQEGKWVEKPYHTNILMCACGNKYIKTRDNQTMCVRCLGKVVKVK